MKCVCADDLKNRVTIKRPKESATVDAGGHVDLSDESNWRIVEQRRWCQVLPRSSREFQRDNQIRDDVTHMIRFRYEAATLKFKPTWKASEKVFGETKYYEFAGPGINENGESRYILFPAIETPVI